MTDSLPIQAVGPGEGSRVFPSVTELRDLGADIARLGFAPHEARLSSLVELARRSGQSPASVDLVIDQAVPDVVRARAFSVLLAAWADVLDGLRATPEYRAFDAAFAELLAAWNEHQRLRSAGAPLIDRIAAVDDLDRRRRLTARSRRRLTPVGSLAASETPATACA